MILSPLIFAVILFLLIRFTNDITTGSNYLTHSWQFIATELTGVLAGSYLCFYLAGLWIRFSLRQHINPVAEYGVVLIVPALLSITVMGVSHNASLWDEKPDLIIPVVIVMLMSLGMYMSQKNARLDKMYTDSKLREQEVRNAKTESELKMLRAQFHPHFLFNMLNTLYFTIDENNVKARETVENMASLLRYQLYDNQDTVPIEREIEAMESYIALYRARFGDSVEVSSTIDHRFGSDRIFPHLLLPLVENAFKHSGGDKRIINIELRRDFNMVEFSVTNTIHSTPYPGDEEPGIGVRNIHRSLELMYKGRYEFSTERILDKFYVFLKIAL